MPNIRLNKRVIDGLPSPEVGQILYRDTELPGFGLRVGTCSRVYFVEGQVDRRSVRTSIGRADVFSPEAARKQAQVLLGDMAVGKHPNRTKRNRAGGVLTVASAFAKFFEAKPQLARCTVEGYARTCELYLKAWRSYEIGKLTRDMILVKHRQISEARGQVTANNVMRHLRSVYNFASGAVVELPPNPVIVLTLTRTWHREQRRRRVVSQNMLPIWWKAVRAETEDARDVLSIALFTGMRRNEIVGLKWEHLDLMERTLTIPKTKNGEPLQLPLSDFLVRLFRERQEFVWQSEYVFPSHSKTGHLMGVKSMWAESERPLAWSSLFMIYGVHSYRLPKVSIFRPIP